MTHWQLRKARKEGITKRAARQRETERVVFGNYVGDEAEEAVAFEQPEGGTSKCTFGVHPWCRVHVPWHLHGKTTPWIDSSVDPFCRN